MAIHEHEYAEKRIALIRNIRVGMNDRGVFSIRFDARFGDALCCGLSVNGEDAVEAIKASGLENVYDAKACFVISKEKDGRFGASCMVGFAGFVTA